MITHIQEVIQGVNGRRGFCLTVCFKFLIFAAPAKVSYIQAGFHHYHWAYH
jgi:hypothetical protein